MLYHDRIFHIFAMEQLNVTFPVILLVLSKLLRRTDKMRLIWLVYKSGGLFLFFFWLNILIQFNYGLLFYFVLS